MENHMNSQILQKSDNMGNGENNWKRIKFAKKGYFPIRVHNLNDSYEYYFTITHQVDKPNDKKEKFYK